MAQAHLARHPNLLKPFTRQSIQTIRDILTRQTRQPESVSYDAVTRRYLYKGEGERVAKINRKYDAKKGEGKAGLQEETNHVDEGPREAAVLLPLANFRRRDLRPAPAIARNAEEQISEKDNEADIVPGILFQVRAGHMRMHAGEVSFPGGKRDTSDQSLYETALRETSEELGIDPGQVEFLGRLGPGEISLGGLLVHVFIGYVHPKSQAKEPDRSVSLKPEDDTVLGSLPLSSLKISEAEVLSVLPLPFSYLVPPVSKSPTSRPQANWTDRLTWKLFRGEYAYRTVSVGDLLIAPSRPQRIEVDRGHKGMEVQGRGSSTGGRWETAAGEYHRPDRSIKTDHCVTLATTTTPRESLEVWGLTGWFLSVFMWRMGYWRDVLEAGGRVLEVEQPGFGLAEREGEGSRSRL